jgi:hypothetical protein
MAGFGISGVEPSGSITVVLYGYRMEHHTLPQEQKICLLHVHAKSERNGEDYTASVFIYTTEFY